MSWLRSATSSSADPWLADAADFARIFVAGDSAGGNIAHNVAARLGKSGLAPTIRIRGVLLLAPTFAGEARTRVELECLRDAFLTTEKWDRYTRHALPEGADRDDPVISPTGLRAPGLEAVEMAPVLVVAGGRDVLRDRNVQYVLRMKEEWGKEVEYVEVAGANHGFFQMDPWSERADELIRIVRRFVVEHMDSE